MSRAHTLAECMHATKPLLTRFVKDFTEDSRTNQAPGLPNHVIWNLGHCALTMHRLAERFDQLTLPESDFIMGDGTNGDASRFDTESVCIDSEPRDEPSMYPMLARGVDIYEAACDRCAAAIRNATDEQLDKEIPWHDGSMTQAGLIMRVCFHNGTHAGQLTDLRRALQMERIIRPRG